MALYSVPFGGPAAPEVRLKAHAVAVPALTSQVRPALVLAERESRALLATARDHDVLAGGRFCAGPAGIQLWDQPWAALDAPGDALHLGSVDWSYDTPVKHYVTIYRAIVTDAGVAVGQTPLSVLQSVLGLCGLDLDGDRLGMPTPPARDPFRRGPR